jgi:MFS family permease
MSVFQMSGLLLNGGTNTNLSGLQIIGFGLGPLVLAPLSEIYGRNKIYHGGNVLFTICTACCGISPNATSLLIFRLLSGVMGGAPLTNGGGTIADLIPSNERGL